MTKPTNEPPLAGIDPEAWQRTLREAAVAMDHWERYFQKIDPNPSFGQMLALWRVIRRMQEDDRQ